MKFRVWRVWRYLERPPERQADLEARVTGFEARWEGCEALHRREGAAGAARGGASAPGVRGAVLTLQAVCPVTKVRSDLFGECCGVDDACVCFLYSVSLSAALALFLPDSHSLYLRL